jgi:heptosyltransferase II
MEVAHEGEKRTLVVKLGAIGDVIMALPMLQAIWKNNPSEQVDWVVGSISSPILESVISDRLRIVEVDERAIFRGSIIARMKAMFAAWKSIGFGKYDRILIVNGDWRYGIIPLWCRGTRIWFRKGNGIRGAVPGRHHSVEYARLAIGIDDSSMWKPEYPPIFFKTLDTLMEKRLKQLGPRVVAVSPAGAKNVMREEGLRRWTIEGYRSVMGSLREKGYSIVLVGGLGDEWASTAFNGCFDLDFVGKLNLLEFIALLSKMAVLVTHDSGPLHMGDLAGVPMVGIFGPTAPEEKKPIRSRHIIIWGGKELPCRPCYDGRNYAACKVKLCMEGIDPEKVVLAVEKLLEDRM